MEASQETAAEPVVRFEWTGYESPSRATVEAVAAATGAKPVEIEPLYAAVDPEALDALLDRTPQASSDPGAAVQFEYHGFAVALVTDGSGFLFDADDVDGDWSPI